MADPGIEVSASTFRSIVYAKKRCGHIVHVIDSFFCLECFPNNLAEVKLSWDSLPELRYSFCWEKLVVTTRHKVLYGWNFYVKPIQFFQLILYISVIVSLKTTQRLDSYSCCKCA